MKKLLDREQELEKIYRYEGSPCSPMFYRPNLFIHSRRVEWLAIEISKLLSKKGKKSINIDLIKDMAKFHDDAEIITGDFLSMDKEAFSKKDQKDYKSDSLKAISILYENYGNISTKYDYRDILLKIENQEGLEFLIVDFADKLDAHLEVTHELFAGNESFNIKLIKWDIDLKVFDYTKNKLGKILFKIQEYFEEDIFIKNTFLDLTSLFDSSRCIKLARKPSFDNFLKETGYILYDLWVNLHKKYGAKEDINYLINQREY